MPFHSDLIGLHVLQIEFGLHDLILMNALAALPGSLLPSGNGSLIQPEGVDNRLAWTAIGYQRHDEDDEVFLLASSLQHRSSPRAERLPAGFTLVSLSLLPVTHHIALFGFPSCRTVPVGAK